MERYGDATYGDGFADVYDEWYGDVSDIDATVERVEALAAEVGGAVLELGVGTGRLAIPLAARGVEVHGVDASAEMVGRLRAKQGGDRVRVTVGPMEGRNPPGPFAVVFAAFNTFFNLTTVEAQEEAMRAAAARLLPGGALALEAVVPADPAPHTGTVLEVRTVEVDRVVLIATEHGADGRTVSGQHIELSEAGIRLRPWSLRLATPAELDAMAAAAGLALEEESADWGGSPLTAASASRVAIYRLMPRRRHVAAVLSA